MKNLDAILEACKKDIDAVWVGTFDCRVSMGLTGAYGKEPEWLEVLGKCEATLRKWDMPCGGFAFGGKEQREDMARGRCLLGVEVDMYTMVQSGITTLKESKEQFAVVKEW